MWDLKTLDLYINCARSKYQTKRTYIDETKTTNARVADRPTWAGVSGKSVSWCFSAIIFGNDVSYTNVLSMTHKNYFWWTNMFTPPNAEVPMTNKNEFNQYISEFFYLVSYHIRDHRIINIRELPLPWIHTLVFFFNVCFESCFSEKTLFSVNVLYHRGSTGIIQYHRVSSGIIQYHPVSSGIIKYHAWSKMIKNDPACIKNVTACIRNDTNFCHWVWKFVIVYYYQY